MKTSLSNPNVNKRRWSPFVAGLLAILGIAGSSIFPVYADRTTLDPTRTQVAYPLPAPPTIDGVIDAAEWERAGGFRGNYWFVRPDTNAVDGISGGVQSFGVVPDDLDDLSFIIYAGYDDQNLYVAVRVRDSAISTDTAEAGSMNQTTWDDDGVEVFVDGDNANAARWSAANPGGQYVITANNAYRENEAGNPGYGETAAWYALTSTSVTGYEAEFRIAWSILGDPQPGDIIGFSVGVNDDDESGPSKRQVLWVGEANTPVSYGNLLIGPPAYTAPSVTTAPVVDGIINPAEYAGAEKVHLGGAVGLWDIGGGEDIAEASLNYDWWVVHTADAIYAAANVIDDQVINDNPDAQPGSEDGNTWEDDSVEIFFDGDNSENLGGPNFDFEGQYVFGANGARRDNEARNPVFGATDGWFAATSRTATGYQVEFKIPKANLQNPTNGASVGFLIAVNDDNGPGPFVLGDQLLWFGGSHRENTYGTLTLGGFSSPPPPTGSLSITGNPGFGQTGVGGSGIEHTFTIANVGTAPLNLSATPKVAVTGPQASDFTVTAQPTSPIPPGGNSSFTIRFVPAAAGVRNATVSIQNDGDKDPFDLAITGTGAVATAPPVAQTVSVNFQGRIAPGPISTEPLAPTDVAGVVAAGNWNNVADADVAEGASCYQGSPTGALVDSTGSATTITLTFSANGGWNNEATATTTGNAKMMHGIIKHSIDDPDNCVATGTFAFNNVPEGQYDLYVYLNTDANDLEANISDNRNLTTYYIKEIHSFNDGDTFVQGLNTDPNGTRDTCSYVKFSNLGTLGSGSIGFTAKPISGASFAGVGIAGIQLVKIPPPAPVGGKFTGIRVEGNNVIITFTGSGVQSASAVTGPWTDVAGTSPLTVPVADGPKFYRFSQVSGPAPAACITTPGLNTWVNTPFTNQTGTFTATFDATPSLDAPFDSVMALSSGPKTAFGDFACLVRFPVTGNIDARNGANYEAANVIPYSAGVKYSFRLVVNIPAATYSIYVTPAGGTEQTVGIDFAFRPTAGVVTNLNNWGAIVDSADAPGTNTVCNFKVVPVVTPAACISTPGLNTWVNTPFTNQTGTFTATFDATPSLDAPFDSVMALSSGPKTAFGDFACLVRFPVTGNIDARNGANYEAANVIPYTAGVKYSFRLVVNIPAATYSIYVTPAGGTEQTVGIDFAFRPTAGVVTNLNNWGAIVDSADAPGTNTVCNFKVVPEVSPAACSTASAGGGWVNTPMADQTGTFAVQFDATPSLPAIDTVLALSSGPGAAFTDFACLARFNPDGNIDARNGGGYAADNVIPYSANVKYSFRFVVDVPAHTYSVYVTPAGGAEQTVGTDFAFRSDQSTVANLDHWGVIVAGPAGTSTMCDFKIVP